jgi:hypothetical protein
MNDNNEIEMVWVEFVGGPLDGQCRNLPRAQTHLNAAPKPSPDWDIRNPYPGDMTVTFVTYAIVRSRLGFRESFKGVLV